MRKRLMRKRALRGGQRGQVALEYIGMITLLLFVALAAIQLGLVAYAVQQAGTASRAAARTASYNETSMDAQAAGQAAMSSWLSGAADIYVSTSGDEVKATATVPVPRILPIFQFDPAKRSATMPLD
ncbi:TadE/TadG family type IV pilus assembly protein [Streptomyces sp. NPDC088400]|uniref:TadE/TadG family type IV pilus assembly protein n=1 Tax=Streptomyces sp. NPDC088400 TaxID=3365861 RepID=UPI0037F692A8|nr:pilus assembly protein [Streptomyces sp. NBC_00857]